MPISPSITATQQLTDLNPRQEEKLPAALDGLKVANPVNGAFSRRFDSMSSPETVVIRLWLAEMSSAENGLILSGPSVNFEPAFFLSIERACR